MAGHNEFGMKGEELAVAWLLSHGYEIMERNWRWKKYEIDIIAKKNGLLRFVEVKTRSNSDFGFPEENVSPKKIKSILYAVDQFLFMHPDHKDFNLDILSITVKEGQQAEYFLIEDVYL